MRLTNLISFGSNITLLSSLLLQEPTMTGHHIHSLQQHRSEKEVKQKVMVVGKQRQDTFQSLFGQPGVDEASSCTHYWVLLHLISLQPRPEVPEGPGLVDVYV